MVQQDCVQFSRRSRYLEGVVEIYNLIEVTQKGKVFFLFVCHLNNVSKVEVSMKDSMRLQFHDAIGQTVNKA